MSAPGRGRQPAVTHEQIARALDRLKKQTLLPDAQVRQALEESIRHVEANVPPEPIEVIEHAIMLASTKLWSKESGRAPGAGGKSPSATRTDGPAR